MAKGMLQKIILASYLIRILSGESLVTRKEISTSNSPPIFFNSKAIVKIIEEISRDSLR